MQLNFTLRSGIDANSSIDGLTVVQRLKSPAIRRMFLGNLDKLEKIWMTDRKKNLLAFKLKILDHFSIEENFHLIIPFSHNNYFTEQIRESIIVNFPNCIDISDCFTKDDGVSFGSEPYASMTIEKLSNYINVNESINNFGNVSKVLIADDVYSRGKTMNVYERILTQKFGDIQIIGGTLISTN